jgi:hypothetical protein
MDLAWHRTDRGYLDLDARIWFFTDYYSISPGMISQIPGKGAKYMIAFTDGEVTVYCLAIQEHWKKKAKLPALVSRGLRRTTVHLL